MPLRRERRPDPAPENAEECHICVGKFSVVIEGALYVRSRRLIFLRASSGRNILVLV